MYNKIERKERKEKKGKKVMRKKPKSKLNSNARRETVVKMELFVKYDTENSKNSKAVK